MSARDVETKNSGIEDQRRGEAEGIMKKQTNIQTNNKTKGGQEKNEDDKAGRSQESGLRGQHQDQVG